MNDIKAPERWIHEEEPAIEPETKAIAPRSNISRAVVELDKYGLPAPKNIDEDFRLAEGWFKGGALPKWITSSVKAFAVVQFCRAYGIQPLAGIQHVCEVNGRLTFWGEGPLAIVRNSGKMDWIREFVIDKDYNVICFSNKNLSSPVWAAVCQIKRFGGQDMVERVFTDDDARTANQGIGAIWKSYKRIMYKRKARAEALKDEFGDVLVGAPIAEYDNNFAPDIEIEKPKSLADELNEGKLNGSENPTGDRIESLSDMRQLGSPGLPHQDKEGLPGERTMESNSAVLPAPHGAASELEEIPDFAPRGRGRPAGKRMGDLATPIRPEQGSLNAPGMEGQA